MTANVIARTGRVQSWLDNPESRLPVSCTIFNVDDSIEGSEGIAEEGGGEIEKGDQEGRVREAEGYEVGQGWRRGG